jgi:hypothetical protein
MATTHKPVTSAPGNEPASSTGEASQSGHGTTFTAQGTLPPVAPPREASAQPPSASDRAFGPAGAIRDADVARASLDNPTWDPNAAVTVNGKADKGGWVQADTAKEGAGDKRMVSGAKLDPAKANEKLATGNLSKADLDAITVEQVAQVNPLGTAPRNILKNALHESWHEAKHVLLAGGDNVAARQMLMAKLWEFRQWHHQQILQRTQSDPRIGAEGLEEWKAAGSTTMTSDIDVNLKGKQTEKAVAVFNELFKKDGWTKESGVVYDVNVYALDFMHKSTFKGLEEDAGGTVAPMGGDGAAPDKTRVSGKEGSRTGSAGGGLGKQNPMFNDKASSERMIRADATLQHVWSLVKMRLYMTGNEWQEYASSAKVPASTLHEVDLRYDSYMKQLSDKMLDGKELSVEVDRQKQTGFKALDQIAQTKGGDAEEVKMAASNRLYEQKLVEMATLRDRVQGQIARRQGMIDAKNREDAEGLDAAIDGNLAILRDLISECAMFSNEAYVTDGAVNHVVVGLQSKVGIAQTKSESMDAFNENVGDSLKEIARHNGTIGEAAYKSGKYLWRMADAARNLGVKDDKIEALHRAGDTIANKIKGGEDSQSELEAKAAKVITEQLAISTPDALMALVRSLAANVGKAQAGNLAEHGQERAAKIQAPA